MRRCAGTLLGAGEEVLHAQKTVPGFGKVIQAWHKDRCVNAVRLTGRMPVRHSGLMSVFALDSECGVFWYVWALSPLKKTDDHCRTRTARQQVGGTLCLFAPPRYHFLFPVKTGKDRGEKWRLGKCCLDVCWLEVQLCLTVTHPARKNRPIQGVTHSGILRRVIFITFTKHNARDAFPSC